MSENSTNLSVIQLDGRNSGRSIVMDQLDAETAHVSGGKKYTGALPAPVVLYLRPASSAPAGSRFKATLHLIGAPGTPLPLAQATIFPMTPPVPALTAEFRLEMN